MGAVRGVLLDESALLAEDENGNPCLLSGSATLLRRLQYSKLRVGICHQKDVSPEKAIFLKSTAALYSFDCILLHPSHESDSGNCTLPTWSGVGETCFFVTSRKDDDFFYELQNHAWRIVYISVDSGVAMNKDLLLIDKLEKLLITICSFSKMAMCNSSVLIVGYIMKPSREEDFSKRGAFPLYPTPNGLMFVPLSFELPLEFQMQEVDMVLHKATDEIISIDPCSCFEFPKGISYSKGMRGLESAPGKLRGCLVYGATVPLNTLPEEDLIHRLDFTFVLMQLFAKKASIDPLWSGSAQIVGFANNLYIQDHPDCCVIDPFSNIYPLLDRRRIQQILLGIQDVNIKDRNRLRAPHFLKVDNFREPNLREQLLKAKLSFPVIVKPQVACGVADAHSMALVFKFEDFRDLSVPLPVIVQEYVDHGSTLFKFYVLGDEVFHAVKKSMPNSNFLVSSSEKSQLAPIIFNSLKSLPIANDDKPSRDELQGGKQCLDVELVDNAAKWLRYRLGLTIFGFDVVIQEGTGDHVIVDLNYLPSFKEVPDSDAIPAFWNAIKSSYELWKAK